MYQSAVSTSIPLLLSFLLSLATTELQADSTTYGYDEQGNRNLIRKALGQETLISAHARDQRRRHYPLHLRPDRQPDPHRLLK